MWAYKYFHKETRLQVPKYNTFIRQNHPLLKLWFEDELEPLDERMTFLMRCLQAIVNLSILFMFVYMLIDPQDSYFHTECFKRMECYNACNKAYFPGLDCKNLPLMNFYYNHNHYDHLYLFSKPDPIENGAEALEAYQVCKSYILDNPEYAFARSEPHRQDRLHTCFSYCSNGEDVRFLGDDRPQCVDLPPEERDQIICLYPEDSCEQTSIAGEVDGFPVGWQQALLAAILASPCCFLFDLLAIKLSKIKVNADSAKDNCLLIMYQIFVSSLFIYILAQSIYFAQDVVLTGRPELIFMTLLLAIVIEQVMSFGVLSTIYIIVVRRFGFLKENEKEWRPEVDTSTKTENMIPRVKVWCLKMLESRVVETLSLIIISLYTVFILFLLIVTEYVTIQEEILEQIDQVFLTIFFVEILLKTFASNGNYVIDFFNLFDAIIVIVSYFLSLAGITSKGLGVLRLIRVVVITVRKITGNQSKLRHQSKNNNPVESVIKILQQLHDLPEISNTIKKEAKFAIGIIESNKLYELNFDLSNEEKNLDMEAKAWLNITTETANDTTQWFERDLDDFLKELHRESDDIDPNKIEEDEERIKQIINVPSRAWTTTLKIMDNFEKWEFDTFLYSETLGDSTMVHFGFKLFQQYGLLEKFSIADSNFANLLNAIKGSFYEQNTYHNMARAVEVTRNFHYFTRTGELMNHFSDLNVMAGLLACLLHDVSHPGVNNAFLIAMKHTKAVRYNDKNVLENHHCAIAFKLLLDPQNDIFELLSEAQYWNVRQIIIKMILSTDISSHFEQIMAFKGRLSSKKFPEDTNEDKQMILNMCIYASDHANPCKSAIMYFKWMAAEMEEYFQQGDIEKKLDYTITPFFDRTTCNPFKYQIGYIDVIVEPLFNTWLELLPNACKEDCITKGLEENKKLLEQKLEETKNLVAIQQQNPQTNELALE